MACKSVSKIRGIATPECALARNDGNFGAFSMPASEDFYRQILTNYVHGCYNVLKVPVIRVNWNEEECFYENLS